MGKSNLATLLRYCSLWVGGLCDMWKPVCESLCLSLFLSPFFSPPPLHSFCLSPQTLQERDPHKVEVNSLVTAALLFSLSRSFAMSVYLTSWNVNTDSPRSGKKDDSIRVKNVSVEWLCFPPGYNNTLHWNIMVSRIRLKTCAYMESRFPSARLAWSSVPRVDCYVMEKLHKCQHTNESAGSRWEVLRIS